MIEEGQPPTGSHVINAGSCTRDQVGPWCDIYLVATEDSSEHRSVVAGLDAAQQAADADDVARFLLGILAEYVAAQQKGDSAGHSRISTYTESIKHSAAVSSEQLHSCISAFLNDEPTAEEGDGFFCSVGSESGWLRISFAVEEGTFSYLFAPPR